MKYWKIASFMWLCFSATLQAEQIKFTKKEQGDYYQFNYQWLDQNAEQQAIEFLLSKEALFDRFRNFSSYKAQLAELYVNKKLKQHFDAHPMPNVQFSIKKTDHSIHLKGKNKQKLATAYAFIEEQKNEILDQYLTANFYHRFTTYNQIDVIKPDHAMFANSVIDDLKPMKQLILDTVSIQNIRKVTNFVLGFVQNIPYSPLESRLTSSGLGFNPPLKLLWKNQGDCDSKVTLTASLLRALMPRINMAFIFTDNHAMIGIDMLAEPDELTVSLDGITYLLAEPTGPALLPIGQLAFDSEQAILQGHYTIEKYHSM